MKYVNIVIDNMSRMTDTEYTYACESDDICIGRKVYVPFARGSKLREGYVTSIADEAPEGVRLKKVEEIDENICLNREMIDTARWMRQRYLARFIEGIKCFTPPGKAPSKRLKVKEPVAKSDEPKALTEEQKNAIEKIRPSLEEKNHEIFLLHGVTSSGKTEVYMQLIAGVLEQGRTAIMMVPEISLTNQVIERFEKRFGSECIAVMHSRLTKPQRYSQWLKIKSGEVRIVIGARSAVFAPLENIGLVVMDEEHESTYKSDQSPKYETIEVAIKRTKAYGGSIVLGSATPSAVSYSRAQDGIYTLVEMKKRYNENPMPEVEIVDMAEERRAANMTVFSDKLYRNMKECLEKGQQVILFLNRRGYSTYISCRRCGHTLKCPSCGISMTYHKDINGLSCHYCGRTMAVPKECPECGDSFRFGGTGTQKLEEETAALFEGYETGRLDLDSIKHKGSLDRILSDFRKGKTKILIGTQLVAKGLDFDNVGLVGIISADNALNIPDYRACERGFQLMTQAAGRAGRGSERGKVIIQTFSPEHYAVVTAAENDYTGFVNQELSFRKVMSYPPYMDIIRLVFSGTDESKVKAASSECYGELCERFGNVNIFRPQPAQVSRIEDTYRYAMMMKCPKGMRTAYLQGCGAYLDKLTDKNNGVGMIVDVNPYSFT